MTRIKEVVEKMLPNDNIKVVSGDKVLSKGQAKEISSNFLIIIMEVKCSFIDSDGYMVVKI